MISVVTFNIRYPEPNDGINYFPHRAPGIIAKIRKEQPDIIGFQELKPGPMNLLAENFPNYTFVGESSSKANPDLESDRIFFRNDVFECKAWGQYALSPTPDIPDSRYEPQSICPRVCTWVRLLHKESGKDILMLNTHLDHESEYARIKGMEQIFETARRDIGDEDVQIFITGDFNFNPAEAPYPLIEKYGYIDLTKGMDPTFHGYGNYTPVKIDYILSNRPIDYTRERWHECTDGVFLSDHDPVVVHWNNN